MKLYQSLLTQNENKSAAFTDDGSLYRVTVIDV